jgi:hypothetical protein
MTDNEAVQATTEFETWFMDKFGKPNNPQQEFVMSCCYHAWMAARETSSKMS